MKHKTMFLVTFLLAGASALFAVDADYGALGAGEKTALSLEQMLTYAIQDEYLARSEYETIMERYGSIRPFTNIIRAEEQHIALLQGLFVAYGFELPPDTSRTRVTVPEDLKTAFETGIKAEVDNIEMYRRFLLETSGAPMPPDVREVFERLKAGSENHLAAFRTNLSRL